MSPRARDKKLKAKPKRWGYSSAGRASALHAEGRRFDSAYLHHKLADVQSMIGHWREGFAAVIQAWPGRTGRKNRRLLLIYN